MWLAWFNKPAYDSLIFIELLHDKEQKDLICMWVYSEFSNIYAKYKYTTVETIKQDYSFITESNSIKKTTFVFAQENLHIM